MACDPRCILSLITKFCTTSPFKSDKNIVIKRADAVSCRIRVTIGDKFGRGLRGASGTASDLAPFDAALGSCGSVRGGDYRLDG